MKSNVKNNLVSHYLDKNIKMIDKKIIQEIEIPGIVFPRKCEPRNVATLITIRAFEGSEYSTEANE